MSTTNQSYINALWTVQNNIPTLTHEPRIGENEQILEIDLDTRKITAPSYLGVQGDYSAETVYFKVNRYYENQDLASKNCIVQYRNANGDEYIYPVPSYDLRTFASYDAVRQTDWASNILIPWNIQGPATAKAGTIKFSVKFFHLNSNQEIEYELNTLVAESKILESQISDVSTFEDSSFTMDNQFLANLATVQSIANDGFAVNWVDV